MLDLLEDQVPSPKIAVENLKSKKVYLGII